MSVSPWTRDSFAVLQLGLGALQCREQGECSPAQPSPALTLPTLCSDKAHGPGASAGSCWAQHHVLAFLLLGHGAKGSPSSCTQLWAVIPGWTLIPTPAGALGSAGNYPPAPSPSSLLGIAGASVRSLGKAAPSNRLCCCSSDLSPRDFPAAPGKIPGQGIPARGRGCSHPLLREPPTKRAMGKKSNVLTLVSPTVKHGRMCWVLKIFFIFFVFIKKKPLNSMASRKHQRN